MSLWETKSPEEVLADIRACVDAISSERPPIQLYVFDPSSDTVRLADAEDFDWAFANGDWIPRPKAPLSWPPIPREEPVRVQPRVLRNQPRNHPVRAFRRPW